MGRRKYFWSLLGLFALASVGLRIGGIALHQDLWSLINPFPWRDDSYYTLAAVMGFSAGAWILTLMRLKDAGLNLAWSLLAWVPALNLVAFTLFAACSPAQAMEEGAAADPAWLPRSSMGAGLFGALAGAGIAVAAAGITAAVGHYGSPLFVAVPFGMGLVAARIRGRHRPFGLRDALLAGAWSVVLAGALLLALAIEGVICILMALPLALPLALIGAWLGYLLRQRTEGPLLLSALLPLPMLLIGGPEPVAPPTREVRSCVHIARPPDQVWASLIHQRPFKPPVELLFRAGIGYPTEVRMEQPREGALRYCHFSTGTVVERVTTYAPGRTLSFEILEQPPLMRELSPYDVHPPHLERRFVESLSGEFRLSPLPDGSTLLESSSRYRCRYAPLPYWQVWVDAIVHRIHARVLEEIKEQTLQQA